MVIPESVQHIHRWKCGPPKGGITIGVCVCGARREFHDTDEAFKSWNNGGGPKLPPAEQRAVRPAPKSRGGYATKRCTVCYRSFEPANGRQQRCVPCRNAAEERAERTNGRATALAEALAELAPPETLEGLNQRIEVLERQMARANKIIDAIGKAMKDAMNG